ncbi:MAG: exodeoxyribonuclease VII small subunit [Patescibacteria group bacterium]
MARQSKLPFAESFAELEKIAEWFEREEIDLEEGLKKFERGLELAAALKKRLSEVENKVKEIKARFGEMEEEKAEEPEADL